MRCTAITLAVLVSSLLWGCSAANEPQARLKVFKPDLAAQCESSGISLAEMQGELSGSNITVHCAQKGHNGMMQMAVCGAPTGGINIYTIDENKLPQAQALGFAPVSSLSEYQDEPCE